ncbi:alpha-ketoglutarate-dependent taurine dioxygenase [Zopfochytrium polystomum]|nr:alpha-ketoglutarate-dependent taurine dioxygenase [Zopfochytrium polystomum]
MPATNSDSAASTRVPGLDSDPEKKALLSAATKVIQSTPTIGTELHGIHLEKLSNQQLDELARLVAERGVVFLRDQSSLTSDEEVRIARYWGGDKFVHTRMPVPNFEGKAELQAIITNEDSKTGVGLGWHQDHSPSPLPGSLTFLHNRIVPETGGDTAWSSLYAAYDRLSPALRKLVDGLETLQEGAYYPNDPDYEPERAIHPLVPTHPVTGWKYLSVNRPYVKQLRGFKKTESDALLNFLNGVVENSLDIQVRFKWENDSVAIWDNRVVQHRATWDYYPHARVGSRFVIHGPTRPLLDPTSPSRAEALGIVPAPFVFADIANEIEDIKGRNKEGVKFLPRKAVAAAGAGGGVGEGGAAEVGAK